MCFYIFIYKNKIFITFIINIEKLLKDKIYYQNYKMKEKIFIGGILIFGSCIPIYNYYLLPVIRHKEMIDKIDSFDKRLKKLEK